MRTEQSQASQTSSRGAQGGADPDTGAPKDSSCCSPIQCSAASTVPSCAAQGHGVAGAECTHETSMLGFWEVAGAWHKKKINHCKSGFVLPKIF